MSVKNRLTRGIYPKILFLECVWVVCVLLKVNYACKITIQDSNKRKHVSYACKLATYNYNERKNKKKQHIIKMDHQQNKIERKIIKNGNFFCKPYRKYAQRGAERLKLFCFVINKKRKARSHRGNAY